MNKKKDINEVGNIIGFVAAIISLVTGVVMLALDSGNYSSHQAYGGDAYTGIQNAGATTADNVQALAVIAKCGFAFVLIVTGLTLLAIFLPKVVMAKRNKVSYIPNPTACVEETLNTENDVQNMSDWKTTDNIEKAPVIRNAEDIVTDNNYENNDL